MIEQKETLVKWPESLLIDPCSATGAGYTVRSLAKGYVVNTSCVADYRLLLKKQRKFNSSINSVYKDSDDK